MGLGSVVIVVFMTYYSVHIFDMIVSKSKRKDVKFINTRLEMLRLKKNKTLEEQKLFISLKYPKRGKFKWSWKIIPFFIYRIFLFIVVFRIWWLVIFAIPFTIQMWQAIIFVMIFSIILNLVLQKFKIQKGDLSVYFKGWFGG